jgi:class 3 adenylate cyclase
MSVLLGDDRDHDEFVGSVRDVIRRQLQTFKGREVECDGELLATFDGPARAIRCAQTVVWLARGAGILIKTGLHTGECDVVDGNYSGFAVDLARKIAFQANGDNILVSRTVKDLVAGSGLTFDEFGLRSFAEIEGEWRLYTVSA